MTTALQNEIKPDEDLTGTETTVSDNSGSAPISAPPSGQQGTTQFGNTIFTGGYIQSSSFVSGSAGWRINATGAVEFNSATIRGQLIAGYIDIPNTTSADSFHVDTNGNAWWGATTLASGVAWVKKDGSAKFTTGTIGGWTIGSTTLTGGNIILDQANDKITVGSSSGIIINGADGTITSNDGVTWKMDGDGTLTGFNEFAVNSIESIVSYYTYEVPILYNDAVAADGFIGWSNNGIGDGGGSTGGGVAGLANIVGTGSATISSALPGITQGQFYRAGDGKLIKIKFRLALSTTSNIKSWGILDSISDGYAAQTTTGRNIRFVENAGTLYAANANGTTATTTDVSSGITRTNFNTYEIVFDPGATAKFYINGTLVATHTTNLPAGTTDLRLAFGVQTNLQSIYSFPVVISLET